eukprot:Nk52_evm59s215 gene=Nk52_evmTU59s215
MESISQEDILSGAVDLEYCRNAIEPLEDSIIRAVVERAQYALNSIVYKIGGVPINKGETKMSYLEFVMRGIERVHAMAGRYDACDETPFFDSETSSISDRKMIPSCLAAEKVSMNLEILQRYIDLLPGLCTEHREDGDYLESCVRDVIVLQAISRRVHFGCFFIEIKYKEDKNGYDKLVSRKDTDGIIKKLRDPEQENRILERVKVKATRLQLNPDNFVALFKDFIIPLTIKSQVDHLYRLT